jgi:hypothetical protein
MYNRKMMEYRDQIEAVILAMRPTYDSPDYYTAFERDNRQIYNGFVSGYEGRGHTRPHAVQIVNSQLMHTVNHCFPELTHKVSTIPNPKGGDMSEWIRY